MEYREYEIMYRTEETHWWFKGKRRIIFSQLDNFLRRKKNIKILDIGCGTGIMLQHLGKYGKCIGLDYEIAALKYCQRRGGAVSNVVKGNISNLPFKKRSFDLVCLFDVLYHKAVKDDVGAMREIFKMLKEGGVLVITDSADMKLWSRHDIAVHARERYTMPKITSRLKLAGFKIGKVTYFNTFLYLPVFIARKLDNLINQNRIPKSDISETNQFLNFILYQLLIIESYLLKLFKLPFGVSIFVIAKK